MKLNEDTIEDVSALKEQARKAVLDDLGASLRLTATYTLSELGLSSFPMTATGKVRKIDLRHKAEALLQGGDKKQADADSAVTIKKSDARGSIGDLEEDPWCELLRTWRHDSRTQSSG